MPEQSPFSRYSLRKYDLWNFSEQISHQTEGAKEIISPLLDRNFYLAAILDRMDYRGKSHSSPFHQFMVVLHGSLKLELNDSKVIMQKGDLAYCPPNTQLQRSGQKVHWLYLQFYDHDDWNILTRKGPYVRPYESTALICVLLQGILDSIKTKDPILRQHGLENSHFLLALLNRERFLTDNRSDRRNYHLSMLVQEITVAPHKAWSIKLMCEVAHVSRNTLLRMIRQEHNISPMELVIQMRLKEACRLLSVTQSKIANIAHSIGYESEYYFSRLFKKRMEMTPSQYRKDHSKIFETQ
jgi:AraC-like DNA-binding protein